MHSLTFTKIIIEIDIKLVFYHSYLVWEFLATLILHKHDLSDLAPGGLVQSDVMQYPTSGKLGFWEITENYGDGWIMANYSRLWHFTFFQCALLCFITFYCVLSHFINKNDRKWFKTAKNDNKSQQKSIKVPESSWLLPREHEKANITNNVACQRSLRASLEHWWVMHDPSVQNSTPSVCHSTHTFCQLDFGKIKINTAKYVILSSESSWQMWNSLKDAW